MKKAYGILLTLFLLASSATLAAPAPANSTIGTQATISYTDTDSTAKTTTSNLVLTTVNSIYALTLSPTGNYTAYAGQNISYPISITNNGNTADTYTLSETGSTLQNLVFTVDTNGNGVIDAGETTTIANLANTPSVASGAVLKLVVTGTVPAAAVAGSVQTYTTTATSVGNTAVSASTNNLYTVNTPAAIGITKTVGASAVPGAFTYIFKVTNPSTTAASNVILTDTLPVGIEPVGSTAVWNPILSATNKGITYAADGLEVPSNEVDLQYVSRVITFKILNVQANITTASVGGVLTLTVAPTGTPVSGTVFSNTGSFVYNNGFAVTSPATTGTAVYTVPVVKSVTVTNNMSLQLLQGDTITIPQTLTNTGNTADTYNLSLSNTIDITGTVFYLDTNGDGIRQAGETTVLSNPLASLAPGATVKFFAVGEVALPPVGQLIFNVIATSTTSPAVTGSSIITGTVVNGFALVSISAEITLSAAQGTVVTLPQTILNKGTTAETYTLAMTNTNILTGVTYYLDTNGDGIRQAGETTVLSNPTTSVAAGGTLKFFVVGTVPVAQAPATYTFRIYANGVTNTAAQDWSTFTLTVTQPVITLTLVKSQALDANGDNVLDAAYAQTALTANPGAKIFYKIVGTNTGTTAVNNFTIQDNVAAYATLTFGDGTVSATGKPSYRIGSSGAMTEVQTHPVDGGTGLIQATIPTLTPGSTIEFYYNIKVNQ